MTGSQGNFKANVLRPQRCKGLQTNCRFLNYMSRNTCYMYIEGAVELWNCETLDREFCPLPILGSKKFEYCTC